MNDVLGNDFEKKMVVMNLLQQYAEDRNVEQFTKGLNVVLETPQEKELITAIRYSGINLHKYSWFTNLAESFSAISSKTTQHTVMLFLQHVIIQKLCHNFDPMPSGETTMRL